MTHNTPADMRRLRRVTAALLIGFCLVALALVFWSTVRAGQLAAREDNPRVVEAALRVQRGEILDRGGRVLAQTVGSGRDLQRRYPLPGGPAVGYYSFRYGATGIEESYDVPLRAADQPPLMAWWHTLQHQPPAGRGVRTTLDATLQQQAAERLASHRGALVVLALTAPPTATLLAMASVPDYDPNALNEQFEALIADDAAPLLNRATQGQYQPGLLLQPFLWAAAAEQGLVRANDVVPNPNRPVPVDGIVTRCAAAPPELATWRDVIALRCPGPMQALADELGVAGVEQALARFGLLTPPPLPALNTETPPSAPVLDLLLAGIGQDTLTVTPLQMAAALAALAANGRFPQLQLVSAVEDLAGTWRPPLRPDAPPETAVSPQTAAAARALLPAAGGDNGPAAREHAVRVLSGPADRSNAWYLGLYPAAAPRYVIVLILEDQADLEAVIEIGRDLLQATADLEAE